MPPPIEENVPRQSFPPRRRRAILSFRRTRDLVWFAATTLSFVVAVTLLVFGVRLRKPVVVEKVIERVMSPSGKIVAEGPEGTLLPPSEGNQ